MEKIKLYFIKSYTYTTSTQCQNNEKEASQNKLDCPLGGRDMSPF